VEIFLCCIGILLILKYGIYLKGFAVFVKKLCQVGFGWENEIYHWPILKSALFCGSGDILRKRANSVEQHKILVRGPTLQLPRGVQLAVM